MSGSEDEVDETEQLRIRMEEAFRRMDAYRAEQEQRHQYLVADNARLQQLIQQQQAVIMNLQNQAQAQPAPAPVPAPNPGGNRPPKNLGELLKIQPPKHFDGSTVALQPFLTQLRNYFTYFPNSLNTEIS